VLRAAPTPAASSSLAADLLGAESLDLLLYIYVYMYSHMHTHTHTHTQLYIIYIHNVCMCV